MCAFCITSTDRTQVLLPLASRSPVLAALPGRRRAPDGGTRLDWLPGVLKVPTVERPGTKCHWEPTASGKSRKLFVCDNKGPGLASTGRCKGGCDFNHLKQLRIETIQ